MAVKNSELEIDGKIFGVVQNSNWKTGIRNYLAKRLASVKKLFETGKSV